MPLTLSPAPVPAPAPAPIAVDTHGDDAVVHLPRRLDVHQVPALHHQLHQLELGRGDRIALDGSVVEHADLAGLAFLVAARAAAESVGAGVRLAEPSLALRLAIEFTGTAGIPTEHALHRAAQALAEVA